MRSLLFTFVAVGLFAGCAEERDVSPPVKDALEGMSELNNQIEQQRRRELLDMAAKQAGDDTDYPTSGTYEVEFETTVGSFTVVVHRDWAPRGAHRFYQLVKSGFFDDCGFFRVVPGFMVQFGIAADPAVHAEWREPIMDDEVIESNERGYITFATSGPDSRTSQVFINYKHNDFLDSQGFSPFGEVTKGMDVVDSINSAHKEDPQQPMIEAEGNAYLTRNFPKLDYVKTAKLTVDDLAEDSDESADSASENKTDADETKEQTSEAATDAPSDK